MIPGLVTDAVLWLRTDHRYVCGSCSGIKLPGAVVDLKVDVGGPASAWECCGLNEVAPTSGDGKT